MADMKNTAKWLLIFIGVAALVIGAVVLIARFMQGGKMTDKCHGVRTSWPWKGYPCGAVGNYEVDGLTYCANHAALAQKNVVKSLKRRKLKQKNQRPDKQSTCPKATK